MTTVIWRGDAAAVAQVETYTPAAVQIGDVYNVTVNGKTIGYTTSAASVANACTGLQALLSSSLFGEFAEITFTQDGTKITGTAATPGMPFTTSVSVTQAGALSAPTGLTAVPALANGTLTNGTTYYYKVTGVTALGETSASAEVSAAATATGAVTVSWTASTGATAYNIYRGTAAGTEVYLVQIPAGTSYTDFGPPALGTATPPATNTAAIPAPSLTSATSDTIAGSIASGTYYYKITAITALGETTVSQERNATLASTGEIVLVWVAVTGATGYKVYRGTSTGAQNKLVTTTGAVTTYTDQTASPATGTPPSTNSAYIAVPASPSAAAAGSGNGSLTNATVYYWKVTATNAAGETTGSSEVVCYATTTGGVVLSWTAVTNATGYKVYRSTTAGSEAFIQALGAVTTFTDYGTITATAATVPGGNTTASAATFTKASVTTSSGPNDIGLATNWSTGSLPANSDDIWFINSASSAWYGLTALAAVTPNSVNVDSTFTGDIGLPKTNATGGYHEYRQDYLQLSTVANGCKLGLNPGNGPGSSRIKLDFQGAAVAVTIYSAGPPVEQGVPAVLLKGTNVTSVECVLGAFGLAFFAGEVSTCPTLNIGYTSSPLSDATAYLGSGCTLTTINQSGGKVTAQSSVASWFMTAGEATQLAGNISTALTVDGGTFFYQGTGTLTQFYVGANGTLDFSRDMRFRTVTNGSVYAGGTVRDPYRSVNTWTNPLKLIECGMDDVNLNLGKNISVAPASLGA